MYQEPKPSHGVRAVLIITAILAVLMAIALLATVGTEEQQRPATCAVGEKQS